MIADFWNDSSLNPEWILFDIWEEEKGYGGN
jgi:hypothetical protein